MLDKRKQRPPDNFQLGKIPPQAVDIEEVVLGAVLLEKNAILEVYDIISPEMFYKDVHQRIYKCCTDLYNKNQPIDLLTLTHALRASGELELVGGAYYLTQLTSRIASAANIEYHARIILEKFTEREIIRISGNGIKNAYDEGNDVFDQLDTIGLEIQKCQEVLIGKKLDSNVFDQVESLYHKIVTHDVNKPSGIPSGSYYLDKLTGGWQRGEMTVIMARPGMGKSSWLIESILTSCKLNKRVAVFSIEMSTESFLQRMFSNLTTIIHDKIKQRKLDGYELDTLLSIKNSIREFPLHICDESRVNTQTIKTYLRGINRLNKTPIEILFIDYLQMLKVPDGMKFSNRDAEVTMISRELKAIAKEFDIPVVVVSSMNRECERRPDKRPEMSDARDSGSIESDADLILALYRPWVYWNEAVDNREKLFQEMDQALYQKITELIVLKQRSGSTGTLLQLFDGARFKFDNYRRDFSDIPPF